MFVKEIWEHRRKILLMSTVDFKSSFKASVLSWFWVVINPALTIAMYLFAFYAGNINDPDSGYVAWDPMSISFIDHPSLISASGKPNADLYIENTGWLIAGVMAWSYISAMMSAGAGSIRTYNWMVTKVGTPISVPPAVVCISRSILGVPLILVSWIIYMIIMASTGHNEVIISLHILQLPLIIFLTFAFMLLWSLFISPFASISKDVANLLLILPIFLQWISGAFIPLAPDNINNPLGIIFRINPLNFLLDNIRGSITGACYFWNDGIALVSFVCCFGLLASFAAVVNRKNIKRIVVDLI